MFNIEFLNFGSILITGLSQNDKIMEIQADLLDKMIFLIKEVFVRYQQSLGEFAYFQLQLVSHHAARLPPATKKASCLQAISTS